MEIECGYNEFGDPIYCTYTNEFADRAFWLRFILDSQFSGLPGDRPHGGGDPGPPTPDPQKPAQEKPKQDYQALYDKVKNDCLAREKAKADGFRAAYRDQYGHRVVRSMGSGAVKGVVRGAYAGAVGGEFIEPVGGGFPGAIYGAVIGGIFGAASGVFSSVVKEPIYREWYDHWNYRPALNTSQLDCDAEARTAVFDAQH